jgi:SAM-dependent methyltransferase
MNEKELIKFSDTYPLPSAIDVPDFIKKGMRETFDLDSDKNLIYPEDPSFKVKKVLIVGCGYNEAIYHALRNPKITFLACDISKKVIDYNEITCKKLGLKNIEFIQSDILKIKNDLFDAIFAKNVLTYMSKPKVALKNLKSLLVENGSILLSVPNGYHFQFFDILKPLIKNINIDIFDLKSVDYAFKLVQGLDNFHPSKILITDKDKFMSIENFICYYLSPVFNHFTIDDILTLCDQTGLSFQNWFDNSLYFPSATIRSNELDHQSFYENLNTLKLEDKWDGVCRLFGPRRQHFFHSFSLRKNNKFKYFSYNLLDNNDAILSINPNQRIIFDEATSSKYVHRANIRVIINELQEKLLDALKNPLKLSQVVKKLNTSNEIALSEINKLLESSVLRISL